MSSATPLGQVVAPATQVPDTRNAGTKFSANVVVA